MYIPFKKIGSTTSFSSFKITRWALSSLQSSCLELCVCMDIWYILDMNGDKFGGEILLGKIHFKQKRTKDLLLRQFVFWYFLQLKATDFRKVWKKDMWFCCWFSFLFNSKWSQVRWLLISISTLYFFSSSSLSLSTVLMLFSVS